MTFAEVDEALYRLEAPYYRHWAGGAHFEETPEWRRERQRLIALWHSLNPYPALRHVIAMRERREREEEAARNGWGRNRILQEQSEGRWGT